MVLGAVLFLVLSSAYGQDWTEREKEMLGLIERLEKRVEQLERSIQRAQPSAELDRRVQKLEEKTESVEAPQDKDFRVYWKEGLRLDTGDGRFKLKIGGRIQQDSAWIAEGNNLPQAENGVEFRRAYLNIGGDIYDDFAFMAQYDFSDGGVTKFKDVWIAAKNIPYLGQIKAGHFKEPFSINELTSDNYITFLERALPNVFVPSRNTGIQAANTLFNNRATWALGLFRDTNRQGRSVEDGNFIVTSRVTGLPWYQEDGRRLLHLGTGFSYRNIDADDFNFAQSPEVHIAPKYLNTGDLIVDDQILVNAEIALGYGPFSVQGEFIYTKLDTPSAMDDPSFNGYYIAASYFLTGEHRPYQTSSGNFGRVKPKRPFQITGERGPGAWELALQYSSLDLNDAEVTGGEEDNITAGVNWYLNPNMRIMLNYVYGDIELPSGVDEDFHALQSRFQVTF